MERFRLAEFVSKNIWPPLETRIEDCLTVALVHRHTSRYHWLERSAERYQSGTSIPQLQRSARFGQVLATCASDARWEVRTRQFELEMKSRPFACAFIASGSIALLLPRPDADRSARIGDEVTS